MKKLVVLGGGESGVGAALLAQRNHWDVFVSDMGSLSPSAKEIFKKNKKTKYIITCELKDLKIKKSIKSNKVKPAEQQLANIILKKLYENN